MELKTVSIENPNQYNFIFGQSHFIKTVEDIHEAMVNSVPGIQFGVAFCEASEPRLVRKSGTNQEMIDLACRNALAVGCGHSFFVFLNQGYFPINVLQAIKRVPEVCSIFCATANPTEVIVAESDQGRGVLGVIDGFTPLGVESEADVEARKGLLRQFGYKL